MAIDLAGRIIHGPRGHAYFPIDETGEIHSFAGVIGDELAKIGMIYQLGGLWRIDRANAITFYESNIDASLAVCDFCSGRPVTWEAECDDFMDGFNNHSVGSWAVCEPCGLLIIAYDKEGILQRSLAKAPVFIQPVILAIHRSNQEGFWANYKGIRRIA